jgi:hypothetical protein
VKLTQRFSCIFIKYVTNFVEFCVNCHLSSACSLGVYSWISFSKSVLVFKKKSSFLEHRIQIFFSEFMIFGT